MLAEQECTTSQGSSYWMRSSTPNRDTGRSGKTAGAETLAHDDAGNSRPCVITCGTGILFSRSEGLQRTLCSGLQSNCTTTAPSARLEISPGQAIMTMLKRNCVAKQSQPHRL